MQEHDINGVQYRSGRLDAFQQFHVFRKLSPLLSGLFETIARTNDALATAKAMNGEAADAEVDVFSAIGPVAKALAGMSGEDLDWVLKTCLAVCQRRNATGAWVQVITPPAQGGQLLFEDIDLGTMLRLTMGVIQDNLANFFRDGLGAAFGAIGSLPTPLNGSG